MHARQRRAVRDPKEARSIEDHQTIDEGDRSLREKWLASFIGDGPDKAIERVRVVSGPELDQLERAEALVRGIHRNTPYHQLEEAKARFWVSAQQLGSVGSTAEVEAAERALAALLEVLNLAIDQATLWHVWVRDRIGTVTGSNEESGTFDAHPAIATTRTLLGDGDLKLAIDPDISLCRLESLETGESHVVSALLASISGPVVTLVAEVAARHKLEIDDACMIINRLAAEVLLGDAVLMDPPSKPQLSNLTFARLDRAEVQAAQLFVRRARRLAEQVAKADAQAGAPEAGDLDSTTERHRSHRDGALDDAVPIGAPDSAHIEDKADSPTAPHPDLPEVEVDLRRVIDAIADDVNGLAAQWSRRFPVAEYESAVERERHMASSVVAPLFARLQANEEIAQALGLDTKIDLYPPPPNVLRNWSSGSGQPQRWAQESIGSMMAFEHFTSVLENLSHPSRLVIREQRVEEIEFDPASIVLVQEAGRLVAAIVDEGSQSLAALGGGEEPHGSAVSDAVATQWQQVQLADAFSMAEATLLHALRLARLLAKQIELGAELTEVVNAGEAEVTRFMSGSGTRRGIAFGLAFGLIRALAPHVEAVVYRGLHGDVVERNGGPLDEPLVEPASPQEPPGA